MRRRYNTKRSKKSTAFNPGHADLERATSEYTKRGGEIHHIEATDQNLGQFLERKDERAVDEFLNAGITGIGPF